MDIPTPNISKSFSPLAPPPRKAPLGSFPGMSKRSVNGGFNWFGTLAFIIFFGVVAWWAGLYGYQYLLNQEKNKIQVEISDLAKGFKLATIDELEVLGNRLSFAQKIINNHTALLPIFCFLEENTLSKSISYGSFSYKAGGGQSGQNQVTLPGKASSFASLAYQEEVFNKGEVDGKKVLTKLSITGLSISDQDGGIDFGADLNINQDLIRYKDGMQSACATSTTP
jgi:hypothetical protein